MSFHFIAFIYRASWIGIHIAVAQRKAFVSNVILGKVHLCPRPELIYLTSLESTIISVIKTMVLTSVMKEREKGINEITV
jgi:hypothetical protein